MHHAKVIVVTVMISFFIVGCQSDKAGMTKSPQPTGQISGEYPSSVVRLLRSISKIEAEAQYGDVLSLLGLSAKCDEGSSDVFLFTFIWNIEEDYQCVLHFVPSWEDGKMNLAFNSVLVQMKGRQPHEYVPIYQFRNRFNMVRSG